MKKNENKNNGSKRSEVDMATRRKSDSAGISVKLPSNKGKK